MWLLLTVVAVCVILVIRVVQVLGTNSAIFETRKRTLFVIAHPDDESMFFAPTLLYLRDQKQQVVLLCLSEGNYYGKGHLRKQELVRACEYLGLQSDSIIIINDKSLPDDPLVQWDSTIVAQYVMKIVNQYNIERVITFDEGGVSGHNNHIAIYKALRMLCTNRELLQGKEAFTLQTVHILRKYMSFLEALFTRQQLVTNDKRQQRYYIITNFSNWCLARRALETHKSQMVWYRQLYRYLSSYLIINRYTITSH